MDNAFKSGDTVRHKSGTGPRMTVDHCDENEVGVPTVWCTWFDGGKKVQDLFPADTVERAAKPALGGIYVAGPRGP